MARPVIAISSGDPCGIGPEVILKTFSKRLSGTSASFVIIGDYSVFEQTAKRMHQTLPPWQRIWIDERLDFQDFGVAFLDCHSPYSFTPGATSKEAGQSSLSYINHAISLWRKGLIQALVTAPVSKWSIEQVSKGFIGQTEYLSGALGVRDVVMMFVSDRLKVALLTRHIALSEVARSINRKLICSTIRLSNQTLRRQFRIRHPQFAICGLNPHAGESGLMGLEEKLLLRPAMNQLKREGIVCEGPFAADGYFSGPQPHDAVVCWYHDQGLIPFKMAARNEGCQLTAGLPFVRTSPDHGSALNIAGKGIAHPGSMRYAVSLAASLAMKNA